MILDIQDISVILTPTILLFGILWKKIDNLEKRLNKRIDETNKRIDETNKRIDDIERRLTRIEDRLEFSGKTLYIYPPKEETPKEN